MNPANKSILKCSSVLIQIVLQVYFSQWWTDFDEKKCKQVEKKKLNKCKVSIIQHKIKIQEKQEIHNTKNITRKLYTQKNTTQNSTCEEKSQMQKSYSIKIPHANKKHEITIHKNKEYKNNITQKSQTQKKLT